MSDIHQEWKEIRQKNGDFINHLDGEMAKLDKKQVELKRREQMQSLTDAGAFAMQFIAPPPFNCIMDDRDILKALNKAQADRIKALEDELLACKEQRQIDLAVKKELDEKLDKVAADYKALWVECDRLKERVSNGNKVNAALRQRNNELRHAIPSCNTYAQQGMQSKIAKQANEIKRLTGDIETLNKKLNEQTGANTRLTVAYDKIYNDNKFLQCALETSAEDAKANFDRGRIKGMQEIWKELVDCYDGRPMEENNKIFGYHTVGGMLMNLSPTWFMNKAREYHEQKEKEEEARDIQIGDEVEIFDTSCLDDNPHSDIGIVVVVTSDGHSFAAVGPNFEGCFDETDIQRGNVKKTGEHFDSIPLDYFN